MAFTGDALLIRGCGRTDFQCQQIWFVGCKILNLKPTEALLDHP
ncbi:hypothetical protein Gotur_024459 [Gossypium turneri]